MTRWMALAVFATGCADPALEARVAALESEVKDLKGRVRSKRDEQEEAVVGKEALLEAQSWVQGTAALDEKPATLFVFWELWCPHCKREVPELQERYQTYGPQGLNVVGVTRLTRDTPPAKMLAFLEEKGVTYPVAVDDGTMSEHYAVSGVPAAALVKEGKVVWRGHPAKLSEAMIATTLK